MLCSQDPIDKEGQVQYFGHPLLNSLFFCNKKQIYLECGDIDILISNPESKRTPIGVLHKIVSKLRKISYLTDDLEISEKDKKRDWQHHFDKYMGTCIKFSIPFDGPNQVFFGYLKESRVCQEEFIEGWISSSRHTLTCHAPSCTLQGRTTLTAPLDCKSSPLIFVTMKPYQQTLLSIDTQRRKAITCAITAYVTAMREASELGNPFLVFAQRKMFSHSSRFRTRHLQNGTCESKGITKQKRKKSKKERCWRHELVVGCHPLNLPHSHEGRGLRGTDGVGACQQPICLGHQLPPCIEVSCLDG